MADPVTEALLHLADRIVNPVCDECGKSVNPQNPANGPHLCFECASVSRSEFNRYAAEFREERMSTKRVHVVKLPAGMMKGSEDGR